MTSLEAQRRFYARLVTAKAGVFEPKIVDAFATIRREQFLGKGPWDIPVKDTYLSSETDDPAILYQDILVAIDRKGGVHNGEPTLHAMCIGAALPQAAEVVIHVGAGTGYYTAVLAHLVGPEGRVHAYEIDLGLARRAAQNLSEWSTVTVHALSALEASLPPADLIYVSAGATHVPQIWLDALTIGGRLIVPLTANEGPGCMLLVTRRSPATYAARILSAAFFIPCIGARDDEQSRRLAAALNAGNQDKVRTLRRGDDADSTAWCVGDGWWLSTAERSAGGPESDQACGL
jgi:protein-L-isoaspartate(D-aspartate) O-methyltransferase